MDFRERAKEVIQKLKPRLQELADGYVELVEADPSVGEVTLRLVGGRVC